VRADAAAASASAWRSNADNRNATKPPISCTHVLSNTSLPLHQSSRGPKGYAPSYIPEAVDRVDATGIDKFEASVHDTAVAQETVTYGLINRKRGTDDGAATAAAAASQRSNGSAAAGAGVGPGSERDRDAAKLRDDLEALPSEADLEAYESMPVEAFGEALLRGMGWSEGQSIGRSTKGEVAVKELVRRPARLGLGAKPVAEQTKKRFIKPGAQGCAGGLPYVLLYAACHAQPSAKCHAQPPATVSCSASCQALCKTMSS
jgi:hypothetical protein